MKRIARLAHRHLTAKQLGVQDRRLIGYFLKKQTKSGLRLVSDAKRLLMSGSWKELAKWEGNKIRIFHHNITPQVLSVLLKEGRGLIKNPTPPEEYIDDEEDALLDQLIRKRLRNR